MVTFLNGIVLLFYQVGMLIGLSIILGLIFLQAGDDFVGVQDRCVNVCLEGML